MNKFMMQQAQKLQAQLLKAQEELANLTVEASSGGGAVTVVMNGQQKILSVKISPEVVNPEDVEMLEDMVLTAVSEAHTKAQELADDYWLYVVLDCASPSPRLYRVQDPARTLAAAWRASHDVRFRVDPEPVIAAGSGEDAA